MASYVVLDSRSCTNRDSDNGKLTPILPSALYLNYHSNWHVALVDYSIHPREPVTSGRPWLMLTDIIEPQIYNNKEKEVLFAGPIVRQKSIVVPLFKRVKSPIVDTISLQFVDHLFEPVNFTKNSSHILLTLAFQKL